MPKSMLDREKVTHKNRGGTEADIPASDSSKLTHGLGEITPKRQLNEVPSDIFAFHTATDKAAVVGDRYESWSRDDHRSCDHST